MTDNLMNIPYKQITLGEKLGEGSYGIVYKGSWQGKTVAIKTLRLQTFKSELEENLIHEAKVMAKLDHKRVVRLHGVCTEPGHYSLLMEFMPAGDLYNLLSKKKRNLPWTKRWQLAIDVGLGLSYLHKQKILHRDLKSQNILLDQNLNAKITDFGLSKIKATIGHTFTYSGGGTVPWMAPELFSKDQKKTPATDIYAYGMVLWEIAVRKVPFAEYSEGRIIAFVLQGEREDIPKICPQAYTKIIEDCWKQVPTARPTAQEAFLSLQKARPSLPTPQLKQSSSSDEEMPNSIQFDRPPTSSQQTSLSSNEKVIDPKKATKGKKMTPSSTTTPNEPIPLSQSKMPLPKTLLSQIAQQKSSSPKAPGQPNKWGWTELKTLSMPSLVRILLQLKNGKLAVGLFGEILILDLKNSSQVRLQPAHVGEHKPKKRPIAVLKELKNGKLASSAGRSGDRITVWDIESRKESQQIYAYKGVDFLLELKDGKMAIPCAMPRTLRTSILPRKNSITIFGLDNPKKRSQILECSYGRIASLIRLKNGQIVSGFTDGSIKIWDHKKWFGDKCRKTLRERKHHHLSVSGLFGIAALVELNNGDLVSISDVATNIWNPKNGKLLNVLPGSYADGKTIAKLPDGKLAMLSGKKVYIRDFQHRHPVTNKLIEFFALKNNASAIAALSDGRIAVAWDHRVWKDISKWQVDQSRSTYGITIWGKIKP